MQARYEPVDLAAVHRRAGQRLPLGRRPGRACAFEVDCPPLPEPVYVDRDMWEKVVLNLLSNALKFTFDGSIRVSLRAEGGDAVVRVADTGIGVAAGGDAAAVRAVPPHRDTPAPGPTRAAASAWPWCRSWSGCTAAPSPRQHRGRGHHLHRPAAVRPRAPAGRAPGPRPARGAGLGGRRPVRPGGPALAARRSAGRRPRLAARRGERPAGAATWPRPRPRPARVLVADDNADMREYLHRLLRAPATRSPRSPTGRPRWTRSAPQPPTWSSAT